MTISDYPTPPDPGWQTLAEFALPSQPGYDHQAATQVAETVHHLNLPAAHLERLKTAVAKATLNAIEQGHRYQPVLPLVIRVLVSGKLVLLQVR